MKAYDEKGNKLSFRDTDGLGYDVTYNRRKK